MQICKLILFSSELVPCEVYSRSPAAAPGAGCSLCYSKCLDAVQNALRKIPAASCQLDWGKWQVLWLNHEWHSFRYFLSCQFNTTFIWFHFQYTMYAYETLKLWTSFRFWMKFMESLEYYIGFKFALKMWISLQDLLLKCIEFRHQS